MPVFQQGSVNTTALIVADLYVQVVPPQITMLNGIPTNIIGVVGTAPWGPANSPVTISDMASYAANFGPIVARKYDMGTAIAAAVLQGANNFRCVRVTDGTDLAATYAITCSSAAMATAIAAAVNNGISGRRGPSQIVVASATGSTLTITSIYTGSYGNTTKCVVGAGSATGTTKISFAMPGGIPEVFDNIGDAAETAVSAQLAGGTDGATTVSASNLLGQDIAPRKGMYALRGTFTSIAMLTDADDSTLWSNQLAFGLSEGIYMILVGPVGQTISTAIATKNGAGIDGYAFKLLMGDWCYFNDTANGQIRLISPQGYIAGRLANLSPEQSSLNKPIYGIVDTQTTFAKKIYSSAELAQLVAANIDVITNPVPGGNYFGARIGHNGSSNPSINGDNYTRMTNYIAYTINNGMGRFIGRLGTPQERQEAWSTLDSFFAAMKYRKPEPMIEDYQIDPIPPVANGYQLCYIKVKYLDIVEKFLISVEGGTTVQITRVAA